MKNWSHKLLCAVCRHLLHRRMRVNQAHKNKPQVLDLNPQLYSFPPSRYFEVFKDQTHSVWCFVYTVWCHHTNLARQFVPRSIILLGAEDGFSNIRFLSRRHGETLLMTCAAGTSISTQICKGRAADAGALLLLTGQTHMQDKSKTQTKTSAADGLSFNLFDGVIKVLLRTQEAINNSTAEGSQIQNKMKTEAASVGESIYSLFRLHGDGFHYSWGKDTPYWLLIEFYWSQKGVNWLSRSRQKACRENMLNSSSDWPHGSADAAVIIASTWCFSARFNICCDTRRDAEAK